MNNKTQKIIGKRINILRKLADIDRNELAEKAEISYNYLSQIEIGRKMPSMRTLEKIAKILNVDIGSLANEDTSVEIELQELINRVGIHRVLAEISKISKNLDASKI